uniref:Putative ovule protein n=1 Tax=Solanum chacoense TaxID=4108 RepID=A0A0V0I535_SOLCH
MSTSMSILAKFNPIFFSVFWSTIRGFPIRLPILLKPLGLQYVKPSPGSFIHMGIFKKSHIGRWMRHWSPYMDLDKPPFMS